MSSLLYLPSEGTIESIFENLCAVSKLLLSFVRPLFSKVFYIVRFYRKYTWELTFENLCRFEVALVLVSLVARQHL